MPADSQNPVDFTCPSNTVLFCSKRSDILSMRPVVRPGLSAAINTNFQARSCLAGRVYKRSASPDKDHNEAFLTKISHFGQDTPRYLSASLAFEYARVNKRNIKHFFDICLHK